MPHRPKRVTDAADGATGTSAARVRAQSAAVGLLLIMLGVLTYGNSLSNSFVTDDKIVILRDSRVQEGRYRDLVAGQYWPAEHGNRLYRPVTSVSFAANWALCREPWAFRIFNLFLHVGVSFVVYLLARDLAGSFLPALVASVFFLVHPIHTEALNAVVERADLGVALFGLAAVWLYWRDGAMAAPQGWRRPVLAALLFGAALGCKENGLAIAGVALLPDLCGWGRTPRRRPREWFRLRLLRCYLPILVTVAAYLLLRWVVLRGIMRAPAEISVADNVLAQPRYGLDPGDSVFVARWATPLAVFGRAIMLLLWPDPLCWDYSYATIDTVREPSDPRLLLGCGWLAGLVAVMIVSFMRKRQIVICVALGLVTYSIVSNTYVIIGTLFAERFLYLPSVGYCLVVGLLAGSAVDRLRTRVNGRRLRLASCGSIAAACLVVCGWHVGLARQRNRDWKTDEVLNAIDLRTNPRSCRLWSSVAADALNACEFELAARRADRSAEICPDYPVAWRLAGLAYWRLEDHERAVACLKRHFELAGADDEGAVVAAAQILKTQRRYRESLAVLEDFVARYPLSATARNNLAWYLITAEPVALRDPQAALRHVEAAFRIDGTSGDIVDTYVSVLEALGRFEEATRLLKSALPRLSQDDPQREALLRRLPPEPR